MQQVHHPHGHWLNNKNMSTIRGLNTWMNYFLIFLYIGFDI